MIKPNKIQEILFSEAIEKINKISLRQYGFRVDTNRTTPNKGIITFDGSHFGGNHIYTLKPSGFFAYHSWNRNDKIFRSSKRLVPPATAPELWDDRDSIIAREFSHAAMLYLMVRGVSRKLAEKLWEPSAHELEKAKIAVSILRHGRDHRADRFAPMVGHSHYRDPRIAFSHIFSLSWLLQRQALRFLKSCNISKCHAYL